MKFDKIKCLIGINLSLSRIENTNGVPYVSFRVVYYSNFIIIIPEYLVSNYIISKNFRLIRAELYVLIDRADKLSSTLEFSITRAMVLIKFHFILFTLFGLSYATFIEFDFLESFKLWNERRDAFLKGLTKVKHCFTETKTNEIMRVINSNQCSTVGLPLEDAIRLEYDNWLSEDWFPNEKELAEMKLDEVM